MKIAKLIFFGFLFILLLFSFTTWINYRQTEAVKDNTEYVSHSTSVVRQGNRFQRNILNIVSGLRAYFLTGDAVFIQTFDSAVQENAGILRELVASANSEQLPALMKIDALNQRWSSEFTNILGDARRTAITSKDPVDLSQVYRNEFPVIVKGDVAEDLQAEVRQFINEEYGRRELRKKKLAESIRNTRSVTFYLTLFSVITGIVIAGFLAYIIRTRILRMVNMANNIAEGDYKVQVTPGRDELGQLASSLNHMARVLDTNISELKRKNAELDQFAHIVSHDLKSPLRGISNVVSWIEEDHEGELSPKVREYMELIKGRLIRGENLIGGILSYARAGRDEHPLESVSVPELLREVMENQTLKPGARAAISSTLPVILTERLPLFQVFSNLVSNAFKYNDKQEPLVELFHQEHEGHYEFFVRDNGPGIAPAYHRKIFGIFQTLEERAGVESTGVGLAIVKKLLDTRQEQINLQSNEGRGTTVSFTWKKETTWKK